MDGSEAAHGIAADEGVLTVNGDAEGLPEISDQITADKLAVFLTGGLLVQIEAYSARRHDDVQIVLHAPVCHRGMVKPVGTGAVKAMQQDQRSGWPVLFGIGALKEVRKALGCQMNVEFSIPGQSFTEEAYKMCRHSLSPLLFSKCII